jgi:hypothetical protein
MESNRGLGIMKLTRHNTTGIVAVPWNQNVQEALMFDRLATRRTTSPMKTNLYVLPWKQVGGTVNDASRLDETSVAGVVRIQSEEHSRAAVNRAAGRDGSVRLSTN